MSGQSRSEHGGAPHGDSAGLPWAGRHFDETAFADDDGTAPAALMAALEHFRSGGGSESAVVDEVRASRLLIPLIAHRAESGVTASGRVVDKSAELAIVTVRGPDGRSVLPVFTSVAAMSAWNPRARPVPADGRRVALAAASENTDVVVLDATSSTEFVLRRPALESIARSLPWVPSYLDAEVRVVVERLAGQEPSVQSIELLPGDPTARLHGPDLIVRLGLAPGLVREELDAVLLRLQEGWARSEVIAGRIDSLAVQVVQAA